MNITMTGVDARTVLEDIPEGVEIGVLYTWDPEGRHRYPARSTVSRILGRLQGRRLSLHVCGNRAVAELIRYSLSDMTHLVDRIQVNGTLFPDELKQICDLYGNHEIVTQHTIQNSELAVLGIPNHALLVDGSGGRGISPMKWVRPYTDRPVGFAGGLGPGNIQNELPRIQAVATDRWWIDMEGKLRDEDDWFDTRLASKVVDVINGLCGQVLS